MRKIAYMVLAAAFGLAVCFAATAQKTVQLGVGDGGSPHVRSEWDVKGAHITIEYGRPYLKGREIGNAVATYGEPWRTGADEATTITSDKLLKFGKIPLSANTIYTINTLPNAFAWKIMFGKLAATGQWGIPYRPELEIGQMPMMLHDTDASVEQVTISIEQTPAGGLLRVEWGKVSASVPFTIG